MTVTSRGPFLPADIPTQLNIAEFFLDAPASRHPHKTAIVGEPRAVSYAELAKLANRVGNALLELGISGGDRVLIVLPDSAEFIASFFGAAKIGAVAVPVNPFARPADYIAYLENSEPRAAIVHCEALEAFCPPPANARKCRLSLSPRDISKPKGCPAQSGTIGLPWPAKCSRRPRPRRGIRLLCCTRPAAADHQKRPCISMATCWLPPAIMRTVFLSCGRTM